MKLRLLSRNDAQRALPMRECIEVRKVVLGRKPGRERADEITYFKSVGGAVQDVAAARRVLDKAAELGLGVEVEL